MVRRVQGLGLGVGWGSVFRIVVSGVVGLEVQGWLEISWLRFGGVSACRVRVVLGFRGWGWGLAFGAPGASFLRDTQGLSL